ncbi:LexA family transcriptional regulator [Pusillimonas sp. NJUB218]|uniref:LexA family protein n=1 Tax=Pusillimonas sp. NJUB218 TaxID=2023230 RepID=UPI001F164FF4|nr:S24 family peptidase [Pusillimonas sp. NJUB218]
MAIALGFKAKNAAYKLTQRLIASGHLMRSVGGRLAPGPYFFTAEMTDKEVRASFEVESEASTIMHSQAIEHLIVTKPSQTVLLKVRGDSMVNAGIHSGDIAVVEKSNQATSGQIVVAEIDGYFTIKQFQSKSDGTAALVSRDEQNRTVTPRQTFNIIGVVKGIIRSYHPPAAGRTA